MVWCLKLGELSKGWFRFLIHPSFPLHHVQYWQWWPVCLWATICFSFTFIGRHHCSQERRDTLFLPDHMYSSEEESLHLIFKNHPSYTVSVHLLISWLFVTLWFSPTFSCGLCELCQGERIHYLNTSALLLICRRVKRRLMPSPTWICRL